MNAADYEYIQVVTTVNSKDVAEKITAILMEKRLAACVQVTAPISSVYRWKGKIESAREWFCIIKTHRQLYAEVEENIKALHPYEVPEIIAFPIVAGNDDYLRWIGTSVKASQTGTME